MIILTADAQVALDFPEPGEIRHHSIKEPPKKPAVHKETADPDRVFDIQTKDCVLAVVVNLGQIDAIQDGETQIITTGSILILNTGEVCQLRNGMAAQTHLTFLWLS